jgi:DNA primase
MDIAEAVLALAPHLREKVRRTSNYIMIQCPYHAGGQENTPSCVVPLDKPVFFCHGCKVSGHAFQLLRTLGATKGHADLLLKQAGFQEKQKQEELGVVEQSRIRQYNIFRGPFVLKEDILDPFRVAPVSLMEAGFRKATLRHFEVGFDSTEARITFPLRNVFGDLVGVSGRTIIEDLEPRYRIYKRELIRRGAPHDYDMEETKKAILWHAHIIRPTLLKTPETLIITEGFKACMWIWQAGYESTVALVGSYLTRWHAELLSRYVDRVILFLDNNEAGWTGTRKAGVMLLRRGIQVDVARYPEDEREQPDALLPEEIDHSIETASSYLKWRRSNEGKRLLHGEASSFGRGSSGAGGAKEREPRPAGAHEYRGGPV